MQDKRVTTEQILAEIGIDVERMAQKVADAINNTQAGAMIDQSEEQVRDAHAEFRQKTYQKAISLLGKSRHAFIATFIVEATGREIIIDVGQ